VSAVTNTKVYDSLTTSLGIPTITSGSLANGDSATWSQSFSNKNAGSGNKTLIPAGTVSDGNSGNNYSVSFVNSTGGTITPLSLAITGISADNKVYDGNTSATVNFGSAALTGVLEGDSVNLNTSLASASFTNKNVGTAKTVSVSGLNITGTDSANYTLNSTAQTSANITARPLAVSAAGVNKVYDGTTSATVTLSDNRIAGDVLTPSYALAAFGDKNVANGKTVSVSGISISGTDAGNYNLLNDTATTTADIVEPPPVVDSPDIQPPVVKPPLFEPPVAEASVIELPVVESSVVKQPDKSKTSLSDPRTGHKTLKTKGKITASVHPQNHLNKQRF
jgi:hypothetical protein